MRGPNSFTAEAGTDLFLLHRNTPPADKADRENNTFVGVCCGGLVRNPQQRAGVCVRVWGWGGGGAQEMDCEAFYLHFTLACVLMVLQICFLHTMFTQWRGGVNNCPM